MFQLGSPSKKYSKSEHNCFLDITVEAKKPNVQTVKFASCTTSGICSDVSEMCSAQVENIATKGLGRYDR